MATMSGQPQAAVNDASLLAWMAGAWAGEYGGDAIEEHWMAPAGKVMLGMFRWLRAGRTPVYEFMSVEPGSERLMLRIKHFGDGLIGWEEKDEAVSFVLRSFGEHEVVLDRVGQEGSMWMTYRLLGDDVLCAALEKIVEGKPERFEFIYRRAG
ncbi:MAG TPA: DUF6265 family protein [Deinococcales bacterium]|nr:DUF6265 family protein [Deinococcales bacterium]